MQERRLFRITWHTLSAALADAIGAAVVSVTWRRSTRSGEAAHANSCSACCKLGYRPNVTLKYLLYRRQREKYSSGTFGYLVSTSWFLHIRSWCCSLVKLKGNGTRKTKHRLVTRRPEIELQSD
ncbi:hypothetical protein BJX66DRAFT_193442 [Aspergillus keveii]|uniref:Secreted protein n=1 Tax=Aspergillus keveii TaxID=714993 RepID=A0ABR4G6H2_9EURO